jgi:hypothetical protein
MLTVVALLLGIAWLVSIIAGVTSSAIHVLLIVAILLLAYDLLLGRRRAHLR